MLRVAVTVGKVNLRSLLSVLGKVEVPKLRLHARHHGEDTFTFSNLSDYRGQLLKLVEVEPMASLVDPLLNSSIFSNNNDAFQDAAGGATRYAADKLYYGVLALKEVIPAMLAADRDHTVSVRMPEDTALTQVVSDLRDLEIAFNALTLHENVGGEARVVTWLPGSLWIEICVGTFAAVNVIGGAVWAALSLQRKKTYNDAVAEHVRALELENDQKENLVRAQKKHLDLQLAAEAKALEDEFYGNSDDPERSRRVENAIERLSQLIDRGAEIRPRLAAPPEEKSAFPDFSVPGLIESRIKNLMNLTPGVAKQEDEELREA